VELTKTRNRWSGVRIRSVSAITPQPRQAQRSATDPASRRQGPYPARRLAGPGPPLSVAHLVREPACRTPKTRPVIFSRRTRSRRTRPDQLHLCGRHCLPATAPKHASGGYARLSTRDRWPRSVTTLTGSDHSLVAASRQAFGDYLQAAGFAPSRRIDLHRSATVLTELRMQLKASTVPGTGIISDQYGRPWRGDDSQVVPPTHDRAQHHWTLSGMIAIGIDVRPADLHDLTTVDST